jgi:hypothetical protein
VIMILISELFRGLLVQLLSSNDHYIWASCLVSVDPECFVIFKWGSHGDISESDMIQSWPPGFRPRKRHWALSLFTCLYWPLLLLFCGYGKAGNYAIFLYIVSTSWMRKVIIWVGTGLPLSL